MNVLGWICVCCALTLGVALFSPVLVGLIDIVLTVYGYNTLLTWNAGTVFFGSISFLCSFLVLGLSGKLALMIVDTPG